MLLYRYFGSHGHETLRDRMMLVSKVSAFNDPFECAYRITGNITLASCKTWIRSRWDAPEFLELVLELKPGLKTLKKAKRDLKANLANWAAHFLKNKDAVTNKLRAIRATLMDKNMRVASFSADGVKPADEILMWSHYALKHTGIRIGFEFPENKHLYGIEPIIYQIERAAFDVSKHPLADPNDKRMQEIMRTKSDAWKYENEYRLITASTICYRKPPPDDGLEFLPFDSAWVKRVDFGLRHETSKRRQIQETLASLYPQTSCFQAEYHDEDFALQYRPLT